MEENQGRSREIKRPEKEECRVAHFARPGLANLQLLRGGPVGEMLPPTCLDGQNCVVAAKAFRDSSASVGQIRPAAFAMFDNGGDFVSKF